MPGWPQTPTQNVYFWQSAKKNYGATKLECLAMVCAIHKFRHYLVGTTFEIYTDHHFLQWLRTLMAMDCARLYRWRSELEEFDFVVKHRAGKTQTHVDTLSCQPRGAADDKEVIGIRTIPELPAEVREEMQQTNEAMQQGMPVKNNVGSVNGYCLDVEGRFLELNI